MTRIKTQVVRTRRKAAPVSDSDDSGLALGIGLGLAALGLAAVAVGTETGRETTGRVINGMAEQAARDARRRNELYSAERVAELKHELTNKELELVRLRGEWGFDADRKRRRLEGEIEVLERSIRRERVSRKPACWHRRL